MPFLMSMMLAANAIHVRARAQVTTKPETSDAVHHRRHDIADIRLKEEKP